MNGSDITLQQVQACVDLEQGVADGPGGTAGWLQRLCSATVRLLPASGAGVTLMTTGGSSGVAAASDVTARVVEELQFTLGEGPCLEAFASGRPVLVPDVTDQPSRRWPVYADAVQTHGVRAVFVFPLRAGNARIGALDIYRDSTGALSRRELANAMIFAEAATLAVLDGQADAPSGQPPSGVDDALDSHFEIHQAQGMVMIQLGVSLQEALVRLRAYAFSHERRVTDVAHEIVVRRLSLQRDDL